MVVTCVVLIWDIAVHESNKLSLRNGELHLQKTNYPGSLGLHKELSIIGYFTCNQSPEGRKYLSRKLLVLEAIGGTIKCTKWIIVIRISTFLLLLVFAIVIVIVIVIIMIIIIIIIIINIIVIIIITISSSSIT